MSEYQYYEFLALDRALTDAEFAEVRTLSTRAEISRTRFVNEYQWGDFRGNPATLMDHWYDAHLYFANWGTRILMLRLPSVLLDVSTAHWYCDGDDALVRSSGKNVVLEWRSEDEDADEYWVDGSEGPLAALVGVRAELAAGDLRPLYLGWLAALGTKRYGLDSEAGDADVLEPKVPPGLNRLTGSQRALADFLRVDADLLDAAAEASAALGKAAGDKDDVLVDRWIKGLSARQKDEALRRLLRHDGDPHVRTEMLRAVRPRGIEPGPGTRTVLSLLQAGTERAEARQRERQRELAQERARREEDARRGRERRLDALAERGERPWAEMNALIAMKTARHYDEAVVLLADLEALSRRGGDPSAFAARLTELRSAHQRKPSLIERLDRAGLR
jgi:hypothetical protein